MKHATIRPKKTAALLGLVFISMCLNVSARAAETKSVQRPHAASTFSQLRFSPDLRWDGATLQLAPRATSASFISPIIANDFPFNAIGPHWLADVPAGTRLEVYIRVSADGERWNDWLFVPEDEDLAAQADEEERSLSFAGDRMGALVFVHPSSRFVQYQMQFQGSEHFSPRLERVTLQLINSVDGPALGESQNQLAPFDLKRDYAAVPKPQLFRRSQWGARPPARSYSYTMAKHLIFHHTAGISDYNVRDWNDCAARVRAIQAYHMDSNGWDDVGYNYLICRHGSIIQGREDENDGTDVLGAHACAKNSGTMGVSMLGYFHRDNVKLTADLPTPEMLTALQLLLAWKCYERNIDPKGRSLYVAHGAVADHIIGHRDVCATACPGDSLFVHKLAIRDSVAKIINDFTTLVHERDIDIPASFTLLPAYPNPFALSQNAAASAIHISFHLPVAQTLRLTIHNVTGQIVRDWPEQLWAAGVHQLVWEGENIASQRTPTGVYFVRAVGGTEMQQSKMLIIK